MNITHKVFKSRKCNIHTLVWFWASEQSASIKKPDRMRDARVVNELFFTFCIPILHAQYVADWSQLWSLTEFFYVSQTYTLVLGFTATFLNWASRPVTLWLAFWNPHLEQYFKTILTLNPDVPIAGLFSRGEIWDLEPLAVRINQRRMCTWVCTPQDGMSSSSR